MKVLITGDSKGLGYSICERLKIDHEVVGLSRSSSEFLWEHVSFDLEDLSSIDKLKDLLSGIDVLIHNAAITNSNLAIVETLDSYLRIHKVNVLAPAMITKLWMQCRLHQKKKGHVIFVSSICAKKHFKGLAAYSMSKSSINSLAKTIAVEMGSRGIRANVVSPGYMETEMSKDLSQIQKSKISERTPMKRLAEIDDVVDVIQFLVNTSDFMNGSDIVIDGGFTI